MARGLLTPVDQGSAEVTGEGVRRRGVKRRILVVDDSLTSRELLRSVLEAEGFETVGAHDGADALNKLLTTPVDLVLTDIEMPGIDGFALCERIRGGDAAYCDTPIVVVTTRDRQEDRRRGLEAGASAYVVKKAFNQEDLLGTIDRLLSRGDWG
jgi:CheY-like chemotaxis protein